MLIYVKGNDPLLAKTAIDQIKQRYLEKNPDGSELVEIDESVAEPNWADLQAVPLFASSRLVIVRRLGEFSVALQHTFADVLDAVPDSTIVVAWDKRTITEASLTERLAKAAKVMNVMTPTGASLTTWLKSRARELGLSLDSDTLQQLQEQSSRDLWTLETDLRNRATGLAVAGSRESASEPFVFFNLVRRQDWPAIKKELAKKIRLGEPVELIIGSLAAAIRKGINDPAQAQTLTNLLMDMDVGLKTGLLDPEAAAALLVSHLPQPNPNRVQWETAWEETAL